MSGEGSLRSIFINTIGALGPVLVLLPLAVLLRMFSLKRELRLLFPARGDDALDGVLLFVVIKETHNYTGKQAVVNFLLTAMMMAIIVIVILLLYLVFAQVIGFIADLIKEVIYL